MPDPVLSPFLVTWDLHSPGWQRYGLTETVEARDAEGAEIIGRLQAEARIPQLVIDHEDDCPGPHLARIVDVRRAR